MPRNRAATAVFLAKLVAVGLMLSPAAVTAGNYENFLSAYDDLLREHVHPAERNSIAYNGIDYNGWAADPRHRKALALLLAESSEPQGTQAERMAFWINAYNFLTIELIVREGERRSIKNLGSIFASPWQRHSWRLAGRDHTLDDIEHGILRPMGDPRIHFAINCASVSCPDLREQSYKAKQLSAQLDEQVRLTLSNPGKGLRVDRGTTFASKIFDWFGQDFSGGNVKAWLKQWAPVDSAKPIQYLDYDWSLNISQ